MIHGFQVAEMINKIQTVSLLAYHAQRKTKLMQLITISIYKLGDVGISSNLIGSLSLANGQCPPAGR